MSKPDAASLVARYVPVAQSIARDVAERAGVHRDDAESSALYGLWLAAQSWNPDGSVGFRIWALRRIRGAVLDDVRTWRRSRRASGEIVSPTDSVGDALSDDDPAEHLVDSTDRVEVLIDLAPTATRPVLEATYLAAAGGSCRRAAELLGRQSAGHVSLMHSQAIRSIRDTLAARGIHTRADLEDAS